MYLLSSSRFAGDCISRTARTITKWITTLNYKIRYNTMKSEAIIETALGQRDEVLDCIDCVVIPELCHYVALVSRYLHSGCHFEHLWMYMQAQLHAPFRGYGPALCCEQAMAIFLLAHQNELIA